MRVQCFLISRNLEAKGIETKPITDLVVSLPAKGTKTVSAIAQVTGTDDKYAALGIREKTGDKYLGWTWRVIDATGRIAAVASSQPGYDHYAKEQPLTAKQE